QGGIIMYILLGLNILGFSIMAYKIIVIYLEKKKKETQVRKIYQEVKNLNISNENDFKEALFIEARRYLLSVEIGMNTIKIIASIAPILGLLGTVLGVLEAFQQIAAAGLGNGADNFASGISLALITTIGGLIVSLPHYIGYNYINGMITNLESAYETLLIKVHSNETN
ncbi:MAG: MotA/TolQ/ExbB proton channel family protein, partial [Campylobacterales bacterium]|nr:MotA/TolQ/ExbB proton channel family protein [Campylobacterales bacterium]